MGEQMSTTTENAIAAVATAPRHYVDGTWRESRGEGTVDVINPATEEVIATVPQATPEDAVEAIEAARRAFDEGPWPHMARSERARILRAFAEALWSHREELADILVAQGGCTIGQARGMQCYLPIDMMRGYAELAARDPVDTFKVAGGAFEGRVPGIGHTLSVREPAGVVSAITPFNYPFLLNIQKIGPSMAAGCTVVLKPTEYICLDAIKIAQIIDEETEIPPGVFNLLLGGKGDVGEVMCTHPAVDQVTFTGSTQTGRRVMRAASDTVKRVTLELGGKSANVIFADADLDRALAGDCGLVIRHCGQGCGHLSRVLLEEPIYDEVVQRMKDRAETVVVGDPADPSTEMGPLVSQAQWDRVKGYIDSGIEQGARLVIGGGRPADQPKGYFMEPTIFADVRNDMRIAQEEIFGPVVCVERFSTEEEAIAIANDSIYGLNGAVWSRDSAKALRVGGQLRSGTVTVNGPGAGDRDAPYGGYKQSGLGREWGIWGYQEYTEIKTLRYNAF
jgi:aldehyde dehydrogenase (NAD+)